MYFICFQQRVLLRDVYLKLAGLWASRLICQLRNVKIYLKEGGVTSPRKSYTRRKKKLIAPPYEILEIVARDIKVNEKTYIAKLYFFNDRLSELIIEGQPSENTLNWPKPSSCNGNACWRWTDKELDEDIRAWESIYS